MLADVLTDCADRLADGTFAALWAQVQRIGGCTRPIRLTGHVDQVDKLTGEIRRAVDSAGLPDGTILVPCGNRRATVCPSCSYLYKSDAWQIVHAGMVGGGDVPVSIAAHPGLFVTVTAPSFGAVHSRRANHGPAQVCNTRHGRCPHGRARGYRLVHPDDDPRRGAPICVDCHDPARLVVWNRFAPLLWKRTLDLAYRRMAAHVGLPVLGYDRADGTRRVGLRDLVKISCIKISCIKVAEGQARGAIHFHGVLRLDDAALLPDAWAPPPQDWATAELLAACWRWAVAHAKTPCPDPHRPTPPGPGAPYPARLARWGDQADTRRLTVDSGELTPDRVAAYLAKYVTKSVTDSGILDRRIRDTDDLWTRCQFLPEHQAALVRTAWNLAVWPVLRDLGMHRWAHQYGFNGHWITKTRDYSTTFAACRERRRIWARTHTATGEERTPLDAWGRAEDDDEVITLAHWQYHAAGYARTGDQALADLAADQARSRREAARTGEHAA
ncbi:replication initiator [Candidatus Frankia alpina]|uniref:Plasmid replication initiator protein n=1 Tax=Candidatus Frankia alpina TaxID=2699483 RepID=A0A4S5ERJ9_9ACTN|nr:replication initiator [Candidatus Frankia alpina]THJ75041.1 plasmid replication initiator protein [Candidatus Frankia alpina]